MSRLTNHLLSLLTLLLLSASFACAGAESRDANLNKLYVPGIELPEGQFRELTRTACTTCHDLKGLNAFKGYWSREQWLAMVTTMVKHGAKLNTTETAQVVDYLSQHFGKTQAPSNK